MFPLTLSIYILLSCLILMMILFVPPASFHLVRLLLDEYVLLAVECQLHSEKDSELAALLDKHLITGKHHSLTDSLSYTPVKPLTSALVS